MAEGIFGVRGLGLYQWITSQTDEAKKEGPSIDEEESGAFWYTQVSAGREEKLAHESAPVRVIACCQPPDGAEDCFEIIQHVLPCRRVQVSFRLPDGNSHEMLCSAFVGPCSPEDVWLPHARHIADQCAQGHNALVLCYGGRKSGKTRTFAGAARDACEGQPNSSKGGFIQHVASHLFSHFQAREEVFTMEASCLGVCMFDNGQEQLVDLLSDANQALKVVKDPTDPRKFVCEGLSRQPVRWHQRSQELLTAALLRRRTVAPDNVATHVVFTLHLENLAIFPGLREPVMRRGKLVFVSFAGSEGLACLGMPSSGRRLSSSLEMILQDCAHEGWSTALLAHFRPDLAAAQESLATLRGAQAIIQAKGAACIDDTCLQPDQAPAKEGEEESLSSWTPRNSIRTVSKGGTRTMSKGLADALQRPPQDAGHNRLGQLEAQLLEAVAHSKALELESTCNASTLRDATESVNVLLEENEKLSREIACINEERRNLKRQTDMQSEKLAIFQNELESYKVRAEHQDLAVSQAADAHASDVEGMQQMQRHFVSREEDLLEKLAMAQRAITEVKQSTQRRLAENNRRSENTHRELHVQAQTLQDKAAIETVQLLDAQQAQQVLESEVKELQLHEQAFRRQSERKQYHQKRQLENTKARHQELLNMLHELEKGLIHTGDDELHFGTDMLPTL